MPPEHIPSSKNTQALFIGLGILSVALIVGVVVYIFFTQSTVEPTLPAEEVLVTAPVVVPPVSSSESLGGSLYEKTQNPLQDKLPEQSPVANPINDAYKNPFE